MELIPGGGAISIDTTLLVALFRLALLSIFVERALSVVFDWQGWGKYLSDYNLKAPIGATVSILICLILPFDVLRLFGNPGTPPSVVGAVFSGLIVAGGSAGSIKLFQDVLGFSKQARDAANAAKSLHAEADKEEAQARLLAAQAKSAALKGNTTGQ